MAALSNNNLVMTLSDH